MRPWPPSFSLENTKTVSPSAISLPPYIVFWAANEKVFARGSTTSALIAYAMVVPGPGTNWNPTEIYERPLSGGAVASRYFRSWPAYGARIPSQHFVAGEKPLNTHL